MKNIGHYFVLLLAILSISACNKAKEIEGTALIGNIGNLADTLYFYGTDRFYDRLDTILVKDGKFVHQIEVDTTITAFIFAKNITDTRVFIGKNDQLQIKINPTDSLSLYISGNIMHQEYDSLKVDLSTTTDTLAVIKEHIAKHPLSLTNIAIIQDYLAWTKNPPYPIIEDIINGLPGTLKDRQNIEDIISNIASAQRAQTGKGSLFFNLSNMKGKFIDKKDFDNNLLLLYFWATWDDHSIQLNKEIKAIHKKWKNNKKLQIVGISLDIDTTYLAQVVKKDTLNWTILKDPKGWDSQTAERYGVTQLPTTFFIDKNGDIIGRDLPIDSLKKTITEHINKK